LAIQRSAAFSGNGKARAANVELGPTLLEISSAEILGANEGPSKFAEGAGAENVIRQINPCLFIGISRKTTKETRGERGRTKKDS
jgi:hypothetical protein